MTTRASSHLSVVTPGERPPPMLPAEVDLGEIPEVMLNIQWLCDSRWAITASPEEQIAAIRLHARSLQEKPAGTLPEDDAELAFLAGYGRDIDGWRRVKTRALEGWTLCSDTRYYRRDMSIKTLNIWIKLLADRRKQASGVAARKKIEFDAEPYDPPIARAVDALHTLDPQAKILRNYLNAQPQIGGRQAREGVVPDNLPDNVPGNYKGKESNLIESEGYISPAAKAAGVESPSTDSAAGCGKPSEAKPAIPVLPWPRDAKDQFWAVWPHKVGRKDAMAVLDDLIADPPVEFPALLRAALLYGDRKPPSHDFAYPGTWLRDQRWTDVWDDPPPKRPPGRPFKPGGGKPWQPQRLNYDARR